MSKKKSGGPQSRGEQKPGTAPAESSRFSSRAVRETVESVIVAFILAFLFRTFEAEAFVIPTGSMAPTLMGAHKDVTCPVCGYQYTAGASSEDEQMAEQRGQQRGDGQVDEACCPLCRYFADVGPGSENPTYGGDRILVSKFAYNFSEPRRWDVIVFKNPGKAQQNFIKRCVGLPEETVRLYHGDVYIRAPGEEEFALTHRLPDEQRAMAQIVYDNDYVAEPLNAAGWPRRWQALPTAGGTSSAEGGWSSSDEGRSFSTSGGAAEQWLRYQHFVPSIYDWRDLSRGRLPQREIRPLLITDFYAYNTSVTKNGSANDPRMLGMHWVGDLMLECELESTDGQGVALVDLVQGGRHFRCELDFEQGEARLAIDGLQDFAAAAQVDVRGAGSHHVIFANIDRQLRLWIDGRVVSFDGKLDAVDYPPLGNDVPQTSSDDPLDLAPAGVASRGAGLAVRHLKLWRDLYYVAIDKLPVWQRALADYQGSGQLDSLSYAELYEFWCTPELWNPPDRKSPFAQRRAVSFPLAADQFFMMGDNSPASSDARIWEGERFVSRELLVGQALLIFWPHSFHQIPGTGIPFPFFPNFARMDLIR